MDLEIAPDHDIHMQEEILGRLEADCGSLGIPLTVFSTAAAAGRFAGPVRELARGGHEIACHGLDHGPAENYRRMSIERARSMIGESTARLERVLNKRPRSFRGPGMSTSSITQAVLEEQGFAADFSVCPQRLDFLRPAGGSAGWLFAPRCPYHPGDGSPYRRGRRSILVVPLSGVGVPFLSGVMFLLGLGFMKAYFRLLVALARSSGSPIVYLFHSYEFTPCTTGTVGGKRPRPGTGVKRRPLHRLYIGDRERRYRSTLALFEYMLSMGGVRPMTGLEYVRWFEGGGRSGRV